MHSVNVGIKTTVKAANAVSVSLRCQVELEIFDELIINKDKLPYKIIKVQYLLLVDSKSH